MLSRYATTIFFAIACWCLLLIKFGYRFGSEDHAEHLPYVLYLADQSLYAKDFFIQNLHEKIPNERTVFCHLLLPFVDHLELACFILHLITTVFLITGLLKLGTLMVGNCWLAGVAVLINFLLFFDKGLGNVELYSDTIQGSSISVAFLAWSLYLLFSNKWLAATAMAAAGSIFHPLDGLVVYTAMAMLMLYEGFQNYRLKIVAASYLLYSTTAGVFIVLLLLGKVDGVSALDSSFDANTFYSIYHEFRLPHHFIFTEFPLIDKTLFVLFALINLLWWPLGNKRLFWFCTIGTLALVGYIIMANGLKIPDVANLQYYKITQWTKFFAILALCKIASPLLFNLYETYYKNNWIIAGIVATILLSIVVIKPHWMQRKNVAYEYGYSFKTENDLLNICKSIDEHIGKDALFVQPFTCSEIKYWARSSSYVDWKAFVRNRTKVMEWYRRINLVYGVSLHNEHKGFAMSREADEYFYHMMPETAMQLKSEGVTHLLTKNKNLPFAKMLLCNATYAVYQL